ncbi:DUF5331 domain-containing protein [Sphaerospermopsis torques-reginae]|uniref:DUF5331 domain-containing protein n=1 Tax=Sphaerospermopsis torques-reginae ITEP-024 TaxID=984208 RepID=A0ABX8X576_9CYAN|nr:DUF5331 domain-containing protein [Sphaerospermopsis torques-reginae]QYX33693.1 DUF5331 domain-containing protein [Sphaerospermopsis torques-reginae ITEP-024]
MDIKQLRQVLKLKWLTYYQENRSWLVKMQIWRSYDGVRRPLSGHILATLSVLEPRLQHILPFILELNNNPDQIVASLGLNFNPDEELRLLELEKSLDQNQIVDKNSLTCSHVDPQIKQDSHSRVEQKKKQVLLRIVPSVEQKQQSISVVTISKPVNHHSTVAREEISQKTDKLGIGRLPNITEPIPIKYQFTGLPVKEISYISSTTNARSLPAWMDEFCPGVNR